MSNSTYIQAGMYIMNLFDKLVHRCDNVSMIMIDED